MLKHFDLAANLSQVLRLDRYLFIRFMSIDSAFSRALVQEVMSAPGLLLEILHGQVCCEGRYGFEPAHIALS